MTNVCHMRELQVIIECRGDTDLAIFNSIMLGRRTIDKIRFLSLVEVTQGD